MATLPIASATKHDLPIPVTMLIFIAASDVSLLSRTTTEEGSAEGFRTERKAVHCSPPMSGASCSQCCGWSFVPLPEQVISTAATTSLWQRGTTQTSVMQSSVWDTFTAVVGDMQRRTRFVSPGQDESCTEESLLQLLDGGATASTDASHFLFLPSTAATSNDPPRDGPSFLWAECCNDESGGAGDAALQTAASRRGAVLCVDVEGLYAASTSTPPCLVRRTSPLSQPPKLVETAPKPPEAATRGQGLHKAAERSLHGPLHVVQATKLATHHSTTAKGLETVLLQRFSTAQRSCPLSSTDGQGALTLAGVWVVPLSPSEAKGLPLNSCAPLDCFPWFVVLEEANGSGSPAAKTSSDESPRVCVRLKQYDTRLRMHLASTHVVPPQSHRKRPRDEVVPCKGSRCATPAENLRASELALVRPRTFFTSRLPLRVLEIGFLQHSCYGSRWCCAADFDVTDRLLSTGRAERAGVDARETHSPHVSSQMGGYHAFYAALRSSAEQEDARVVASLKAVWDALDDAYPIGSARPPSPPSSAYVSAPTNSDGGGDAVSSTPGDLFADDDRGGCGHDVPSSEQHLPGTTAQTCLPHSGPPAWSMRVLRDMWTRLGWVPPAREGFFSVQMDADDAGLPSYLVGEEQRKSRRRCFTPAEWMEFMAQCTEWMDNVYVQEMLASLNDDDRGEETHDQQQQLALQSFGDEEQRKDGTAWRDDSCCRFAPQPSAVMTESLTTLQRLYTFRAALLDAEVSNSQCRSPLLAYTYFSPAAQALAADVAFTTPFDGVGSEGASGPDALSHMSLSLAFAQGVLESPALLFLSFSPSTTDDGVPCVDESAKGVAASLFLPSSLSNAAASVITRLLHQRPAAAAEREAAPGLTTVAAAAADDQEATCEVADMAELRWRSPRRAVPYFTSENTSCCCSCAQACRLAALLCSDKPSTAAAAAVQSTEGSGTPPAVESVQDATAQWLSSAFVDFLSRNGVPVPAGTVPTESSCPTTEAQPCRERGTQNNETDVIHAVISEATPTTSLDEAAVSELLTATIVRCVQQNKPVVRRLMRLVQTYAGPTLEDNAVSEWSATQKEGCGSVNGAVLEATGQREAEVCRVWHCLCDAQGDASTSTEAEWQAECASELAVRQLQGFWTSVAAVARETVRRRWGGVLSANASHAAGVAGTLLCEEGCDVASDAAGTASKGLGGASGETPVPTDAAASAFTHPSTLPGFNQLKPCEDEKEGGGAMLETALSALDGPRAMQLYMRHILRCQRASDAQSLSDSTKEKNDATSLKTTRRLETEATTAATFGDLLQPHLWLQHALFLLSYGADAPPPGPASESLPQSAAVDGRAMNSGVNASVSSVVSPSLATFRVLRGGKLVLDAWILAALDEYASRWHRTLHRETCRGGRRTFT